MPRILVIDDNADICILLATRLRQQGFDVTTAQNGADGVVLAESETPHLILMDMNMPDVDGWEATKLIRATGSRVPILALTGHTMEGDRQRAMDAGCSDYLNKPVDWPKLLEIIDRLLSTPSIG